MAGPGEAVRLLGAAGGVVSVAMPAMPGVFHFAHFRCKKGAETIFDLPKMTPKQPDVLSQYYTSVLSQQQTSVLSQQQTFVLSQPVLARTGKLSDVR